MNYKRLVWGVVFIFLGILLILKNLDVIYFNWHDLWHLWPMVLVLWGVSMLPIKDGIKISITTAILLTGVWIFVESDNLGNGYKFDNDWKDYKKDYVKEYNHDSRSSSNQDIYEEYVEDVERAILHLNAAAGDFDLDGTTIENFIELSKKGNIGDYVIDKYDQDNATKLVVSLENKENRVIKDNVRNRIDIKLNPNPIWDVEIESGAAAVDMDLREFKVRNIKIEGGATSIKVKLGDQTEDIDVRIESGVSSITIYIPKSAGCTLKTSTFLSGKSLNGFTKIESGRYETPNIDDATQKINIQIEAALSSFKVKRY